MRLRLFPRTRFGRLRLATLVLLPAVGVGVVLAIAVPMPGRSHTGPLPPLSAKLRASADRLRRTVHELAGRIGERNFLFKARLDEAEELLRTELSGIGHEVHRHAFRAQGRYRGDLAPEEEYANLEVILPGDGTANGCLVLGAHYDSIAGSPGADDNASGSAALLELARLLRGRSLRREVRLVFFTNEEPPFFQREGMGSRVYARQLAEQGNDVFAMISLESIGCFSSEPRSQRYPFPFQLLYPGTGDFIGFVGNVSSRALVQRAIGTFRRSAEFPSEGVAAPAAIPGIGWSDHWSFWQEGWPAMMVTDTAPFRNPTYHDDSDTPDTLDYEAMARVVDGMLAVVLDLAG